jgi:hypothetical protein
MTYVDLCRGLTHVGGVLYALYYWSRPRSILKWSCLPGSHTCVYYDHAKQRCTLFGDNHLGGILTDRSPEVYAHDIG